MYSKASQTYTVQSHRETRSSESNIYGTKRPTTELEEKKRESSQLLLHLSRSILVPFTLVDMDVGYTLNFENRDSPLCVVYLCNLRLSSMYLLLDAFCSPLVLCWRSSSSSLLSCVGISFFFSYTHHTLTLYVIGLASNVSCHLHRIVIVPNSRYHWAFCQSLTQLPFSSHLTVSCFFKDEEEELLLHLMLSEHHRIKIASQWNHVQQWENDTANLAVSQIRKRIWWPINYMREEKETQGRHDPD